MYSTTPTEPTRIALATRLLHPLQASRAIPPAAVAYAVHGLVLFLAIVGATFIADYPAWKMLVFSAGAVILFWVAHVYSATLAHDPGDDSSVRADLATVRNEAKRALPLLEACLAPMIPLLLAVLGLLALPLAYAASLTIGMATLAMVGFVAVHNRRASVRRSLAAAVTTGGFGAAIIAAETFWH